MGKRLIIKGADFSANAADERTFDLDFYYVKKEANNKHFLYQTQSDGTLVPKYYGNWATAVPTDVSRYLGCTLTATSINVMNDSVEDKLTSFVFFGADGQPVKYWIFKHPTADISVSSITYQNASIQIQTLKTTIPENAETFTVATSMPNSYRDPREWPSLDLYRYVKYFTIYQ